MVSRKEAHYLTSNQCKPVGSLFELRMESVVLLTACLLRFDYINDLPIFTEAGGTFVFIIRVALKTMLVIPRKRINQTVHTQVIENDT